MRLLEYWMPILRQLPEMCCISHVFETVPDLSKRHVGGVGGILYCKDARDIVHIPICNTLFKALLRMSEQLPALAHRSCAPRVAVPCSEGRACVTMPELDEIMPGLMYR